MSGYIGSKCIICEKTFSKDDDIVVCPDCGTPYHRDCYTNEGKCVNNILHSKNQSWKATFQKEDTASSETIKCKVCGTDNPKSGLFCEKCGTPISISSQNTNPFGGNGTPPVFAQMGQDFFGKDNVLSPDKEIDGVKVKDFNDYAGSNQLYYLAQFLRFDKFKSKISINLSALVLPELYFFYRKMNLIGVLVYILRIVLMVPYLLSLVQQGVFNGTIIADTFKDVITTDALENIWSIFSFINMILIFSCSSFANYFYFQKAKKDINLIKSQDISDEQKTEKIKAKGGVSARNAFIAGIIPLALSLVVLLLIKLL